MSPRIYYSFGWTTVVVLCGLLTPLDRACGDVIVLKSGQKIEGDVLKTQEDAIYVDVGVDVVKVPLSRIQSRTKSAPPEGAKPENPDAFFSTQDLPIRSVKDLAATYGEGVVLVQTPSGLGSGFIINDRGFCVTNYHVVERETRIAVTIFHKTKRGEFDKRRIKDVKITALNPFFDLALLQLPAQKDFKFRPVAIAKDDSQKEGDEVFAIGNPLGLDRSVSKGIVSNKNRSIGGLVYIQMTAQINPGNSGGPLFNTKGQVVGITNMGITSGEGLGFAIPVAYLKHFLNNRDAFAFDKSNANSGFRYLDPPRRRNPSPPPSE